MIIKELRDIEHLDNPEGNNNSGSSSSFYWRDLYKSFIYPEDTERRSKPIDFWYEDMFYGRVDADNLPAYPLEASLKQLGGPNTVLALNFVADAWSGFKDFIDESIKLGAISASPYSSLIPARGWISLHNVFHEYNSTMYKMFSGPFMNQERDEKMKDFNGFLKVYAEFIQQMGHLFPITREAYITSNRCPPQISGLVIETSKESQAEDSKKVPFFEDINFDYIVIAAKKHGFKVDKNAPWRFVADFDSPAMKTYMIRIADNKKMAFDLLFLKSYEHDMDIFKHYAWGWYNQYVASRPMLQVVIPKCKGQATSSLIQREVLTEQQAFAKISDSKWLRIYAYARAVETRQKWNQVKFDRVVKESSEYAKYRGRNTGMKNLYKNIKDYPKKQYSVEKTLTDKEIDAIIISNINKGVKGTFNF